MHVLSRKIVFYFIVYFCGHENNQIQSKTMFPKMGHDKILNEKDPIFLILSSLEKADRFNSWFSRFRRIHYATSHRSMASPFIILMEQ